MSDNLFSAVLTFSLLAAGTARSGRKWWRRATPPRRPPWRSLPAVTVVGKRIAAADAVTLPTVVVTGRRQVVDRGRRRRHRPRVARRVGPLTPGRPPAPFRRPPSGGRFLLRRRRSGAAALQPGRHRLLERVGAVGEVGAASRRSGPGGGWRARIRSSSARACTRTMLRVSARLAAPGRISSAAMRLTWSRCTSRRSGAMSPRPSSSLQTACVSRAVELGHAQGAAGAGRRLLAALEQARRDRVAHHHREQRALQAEHLLRRRVVGLGRALAAEERIGALAKSAPSLRCSAGETRKLSAESRLPVMTSSASRCSATGTGVSGSRPVPGASRTRAHAADLARQHVGGAGDVAQRVADRALEHVVVLVGPQRPRLLALEQVLRDRDPLLGEGDDVAAEVELQRLGIDADEVVLVGAVGEQRLGAAAGDLLERGALVGGRQARCAAACRRTRSPSSRTDRGCR